MYESAAIPRNHELGLNCGSNHAIVGAVTRKKNCYLAARPREEESNAQSWPLLTACW
jgi:hypothetical protein